MKVLEAESVQFDTQRQEPAKLIYMRTMVEDTDQIKESRELFSAEDDIINEDTTITKYQFEVFRITEMVRLFFLSSSLLLGLIAYDNEFVGDTSLNRSLLLYALFFQTIALSHLETMTCLAWFLQFSYKLQCNEIPQNSHFIGSDQFYFLLLDILVQIPHPTPFTQDIKIFYTDNVLFEDHFYYLNELLIYLLCFRTVLAFRCGLKFTQYYTPSVGRICKFYSVRMEDWFIVKCLVRDRPFTLQFTIYVVGTFMMSIMFRVAERPMDRTINPLSGEIEITYSQLRSTYTLAMWITTITIPTVGYGDFFPFTNLGRLSMCLCVMWGINMTSLFLASLMSTISVMKGEILSFALMDRILEHRVMKQEAAYVVTRLCRMFLHKRKNKLQADQLNQVVDQIRQGTQGLKRRWRFFSSIDGESLLDMMDRNFTYLRHQNRDLLNQLKQLKAKQELIRNALPALEPSIKLLHRGQSISSKGLKSLNSEVKTFRTFQSFYFGNATKQLENKEPEINPDYILQGRIFQRSQDQHSGDVRSKDQEYFDQLVDEEKELEIILFDDDQLPDDTKNE